MIKVIWTENGIDYDLSGEGLALDNSLRSLVVYCLFTDARAEDDDELPSGTDKRGWPGNTYSEFGWGSRLWLLTRKKITRQTIFDAKSYAEEALKPITDKLLAKRIEVESRRTSRDIVTLSISITLNDGSSESYQAALQWSSITAQSVTT